MKKLAQKNTQLVSKLMAYLDLLERQFELKLDEVNCFQNLFQVLHPHLQDEIMKKENMMKNCTKLEKVAHFLKSTARYYSEETGTN